MRFIGGPFGRLAGDEVELGLSDFAGLGSVGFGYRAEVVGSGGGWCVQCAVCRVRGVLAGAFGVLWGE